MVVTSREAASPSGRQWYYTIAVNVHDKGFYRMMEKRPI